MQTTVRQNIENVLKVSEFYCENLEKSQFQKLVMLATRKYNERSKKSCP
jgi:hypothetical protein